MKIYEIKIVVNTEINDFELQNLFENIPFIDDVEYVKITGGQND